jgi:prepilin-type N-terminal cleavage/methylation domain-containing protein
MEYCAQEPVVRPRQTGFTLLEISLVLTLIALLAGAVLTGRHLIRSGELQSVIADVERFKTSAIQFREKYKELPGDFTGATTIWGSDAGCPETPANAVRKITTCNGNGDGYIAVQNTFVAGQDSWEMLRAWQHIANAGFIDGQYVGTITTQAAAATTFYQAGWNTPTSKFRKDFNGYVINYFGPDDGSSAGTYAGEYGHVIIYDNMYRASAADPVEYALTPEDAFTLDGKVDDGSASTGKVRSFKTGALSLPQCLAANQYVTDGTVSTNSCRLIFITGW